MEITLKTYIDEENYQEIDINMETIKLVGVGLNATKMVQLSDGKIGFLKNSAETTNGMLDNLEYFISIMGRHILGFNLAKVSKAYDKDEFVGIISENVTEEDERLMMFSQVIDTLVNEPTEKLKLIEETYKDLRNRNIQTYHKPNGNTIDFPTLTSEEDIKHAIDMFPLTLDYLNIPEEQKESIKKEYFQMIVLDLLIGQKDRNNNNYGILYNQKSKTTRFSPLFDNSTINMPGIPENLCQLNGFLIDRKQMMGVLVEHYGEYTLDIIKPIIDNQEDILRRTDNLSKKVLTKDESNWVMQTFTEGINTLSAVSKEKISSSKK